MKRWSRPTARSPRTVVGDQVVALDPTVDGCRRAPRHPQPDDARGARLSATSEPQTTMLTSFGARTITLRTCLPVQRPLHRLGRPAPAASRSASVMSGRHLQPGPHLALHLHDGGHRRPRPAAPRRRPASRRVATVGSWPSRSHISSAVYGATSYSRIATASAASRTAGSAGPAAGVDRLAGGVDQLHHPGDHHVEAVRLDQLGRVVHASGG